MDTEAGWYSPAADESPEWGPCPTCGTANAATARFCQACGRPLIDPGPDPLVIDVLTAVVAELVSATEAFALAPDADERLTAVRDAFVGAGGLLHDLPGSPHTVAAVFGPAPRDGISTMTAVRSALAARDVATGGDVALRLGLGASDVRGDDEQAVELWRGRVVDLAFRLSRMAGPGEVVLGEGAYRLIRELVEAEAIDPRADLDGDDVGPLRLRGLIERDAWAVPADTTEAVENVMPAAQPAPEPHAIERPFDPWAEAFGLSGRADEPPETTYEADPDPAPAYEEVCSTEGESASVFDAAAPGGPPPNDLAAGDESSEPSAAEEADGASAPDSFYEVSEEADDDERPPLAEASPFAAVSSPLEDVGPAEDAAPFEETAPTTFDPEPLDAAVEPAAAGSPAAGSPTVGTPTVGTATTEAPTDPVDEISPSGDEDEMQPDADHAAPHEPDGAALLEREPVLSQLREALDRAIEHGRPVTISVGGRPGSGRTAAIRWFAAATGDHAWTVELSCRPIEAGGTAWPFAALVRAVAGVDAPLERADLDARLLGAVGEERRAEAAALARYLIGDGGDEPADETRGAIGALLSATVARRPLIVIADDADRAPAASRAAFDDVVARVEGPLLVASIVGEDPADVVVRPLSERASGELVERLLAHPNLPPDATASIVAACGGLPLAVEHLVAMLADDGHLRWEYGRWTPTVDLASLPLPADLPSLVARRIGGLAPDERRVAAVAASIGGTFEPGIVAGALDEDVPVVATACAALVDRGIFRRVGEDEFSFGHDALAERAATYTERDASRAIHVSAAERLERDRASGADVDEEIGSHLERAYRAASGDPGRDALGRRAADHLARAARGATDVGDEDASLALLRRAAAVLPPDDAGRALLLLDSATTLAARGERGAAERLLGDAIRAARAAGDDLVELRAVVARARMLAAASRIEDQVEALRDAADAAIAVSTARDDAATAASGWSARGWVYVVRGHFAGAADAFQRAADAAAAAGRRRDELSALRDLSAAIVDGPAPVEEAIERCSALLERAGGTAVEPDVASALAVLRARAGRADDAGEMLARIDDLHVEPESTASVAIRSALVALHAGAAGRAEPPLRAALARELVPADRGAVGAWLTYVLTELGRTDEAAELSEDVASLADDDDVVSQVTWRAALSRCQAARGRHADARALVRLALRLADQTDLSELRARTRLDLAEVLLASGRPNEAAPAARAALRALERKGSVAQTGRARSILERTRGRTERPSENADVETPGTPDEAHEEADAEAPAIGRASSEASDDATGAQAPATVGVATPRTNGSAGSETSDLEPAEGAKRHWFW